MSEKSQIIHELKNVKLVLGNGFNLRCRLGRDVKKRKHDDKIYVEEPISEIQFKRKAS